MEKTRYYDLPLFIEQIESIKGIVFLREEYSQEYDLRVKNYEGLTGDFVMIDVSDGEDAEISQATACGYLRELGLHDYVEKFFPPLPPEITEDQQPNWDLANSFIEDDKNKEDE